MTWTPPWGQRRAAPGQKMEAQWSYNEMTDHWTQTGESIRAPLAASIGTRGYSNSSWSPSARGWWSGHSCSEWLMWRDEEQGWTCLHQEVELVQQMLYTWTFGPINLIRAVLKPLLHFWHDNNIVSLSIGRHRYRSSMISARINT